MPVWLVTPPSGEPVTLAEAKTHLRLDPGFGLDDDFVNSCITAARLHVESLCWRGLLTQTWELVVPGFLGADRFELAPSQRRNFSLPVGYEWSNGDRAYRWLDYLELERGQVGTLASDAVKYIDPDGVQQTLASTEYTVDNVSVPGRLRLAYGKSWPSTRDQWDAVRIRYPVGWANAAAVPEPLKQALKLQLSAMYDNRNPAPVDDFSSFDALISPYRLMRL